MKYDVIVVGGGPSGLMAGIAAAEARAKVLLVEKKDKLGRKLAISGGGRCNVTNNKDIEELIRHIPGNGKFLHSVFATFNNKDIIRFFEDLGIPLKEEDHGRMFPATGQAKTVVEALVRKLRRLGAEIRLNTPVTRVVYEHGRAVGVELHGRERVYADNVIVAAGGMSVPPTGSTGDGYTWAREAGHTITELFPTEVPITSDEPFIRSKALMGLPLRNVRLTVWSPQNKKIISHEGDMIFTHFGLSGPAALRCSQFVVKGLKQYGANRLPLSIDLFPDKHENELQQEILRLLAAEPKKKIKTVLKSLLPDRLAPLLLDKANVSGDTTCQQLPKKAAANVAEAMKRFVIQANGTLPLAQAFVTGGGVHLKEINPKTLESKIMPGLFFCGEILDIHGYTGGYNITAALCTGYTAGKHAAAKSRGQILTSAEK